MSPSKSSIPPSPWQRYLFLFFFAWIAVVVGAYFFVEDVQAAVQNFVLSFFDAP